MALNLNQALDAMYVRDPNLRNVNTLEDAVRVVIGLADVPVPVGPSPIGVQRVDVRQSNGSIATTYEVVDRRKVRSQRIVASGLSTRQAAEAEAAKRRERV